MVDPGVNVGVWHPIRWIKESCDFICCNTADALPSYLIYSAETINQFEREHIKKAKVIEFKRLEPVKREEPGLSSNRIQKRWRI
jgi:hypothetical protein